MNPGNSVQDVNTEPPPCPSGQDDASRYAATADNGSTPTRSPKTPVPPQVPRPQRAVQDIQDIIDKLAAVTQQLRHPHRN
jgi:hypothetical protein